MYELTIYMINLSNVYLNVQELSCKLKYSITASTNNTYGHFRVDKKNSCGAMYASALFFWSMQAAISRVGKNKKIK